jgi:hypothetical protein
LQTFSAACEGGANPIKAVLRDGNRSGGASERVGNFSSLKFRTVENAIVIERPDNVMPFDSLGRFASYCREFGQNNPQYEIEGEPDTFPCFGFPVYYCRVDGRKDKCVFAFIYPSQIDIVSKYRNALEAMKNLENDGQSIPKALWDLIQSAILEGNDIFS